MLVPGGVQHSGPGLQVGEVAAAYEQMAFSEAAAAIQKLSARGNLFMEEQAPWTAFKKASCQALSVTVSTS